MINAKENKKKACEEEKALLQREEARDANRRGGLLRQGLGVFNGEEKEK